MDKQFIKPVDIQILKKAGLKKKFLQINQSMPKAKENKSTFQNCKYSIEPRRENSKRLDATKYHVAIVNSGKWESKLSADPPPLDKPPKQ